MPPATPTKTFRGRRRGKDIVPGEVTLKAIQGSAAIRRNSVVPLGSNTESD
jgi:hypothetical protein